MNGAAAKNLAMKLATKTYRGLNSLGRSMRETYKRKAAENQRKGKENIRMGRI